MLVDIAGKCLKPATVRCRYPLGVRNGDRRGTSTRIEMGRLVSTSRGGRI